jgi:hypothetical protein
MWDFKPLKFRNSFNFSYAINVLTALSPLSPRCRVLTTACVNYIESVGLPWGHGNGIKYCLNHDF